MDKFYRNRGIINLCQTGQLTQAPIAQSLEISQGRVSQLYGQFQEAGEAGLVVKRATGAPPKLTTEPRALLPELFSKGAEHYGFEGKVWTRLRVGEVIKPHFGVHYEVSTIGLLLKPLGFTLPKPTLCSYRQNLARVAQWQEETLPELKTTAEPENQLVFYVDESAFYLLPQVRKIWAPVGQTPILYLRLSRYSLVRDKRD